jgi:hypothetical protein
VDLLLMTREQNLESAADFQRLALAFDVRARSWEGAGLDPSFLLKVAAFCRHEMDRLTREAAGIPTLPPNAMVGAPRSTRSDASHQ